MEYLQATSAKIGLDIADLAFAVYLDNQDPLAGYHNEFVVPTLKEAIVVPEGPSSDGAPAPDMASGGDATGEVVYLCGNSLGLLPKRSKQRVEEELGVWGAVAVIGHHRHQFGRPWVTYMDELVPKMAPLVGAKPVEVAIMNSLTVNVHLMLAAFYKPTKDRYKILIEEKAFPSDHYAVESQIKLAGHDPSDALVTVGPREGEHTIRTEDIIDAIHRHGDSLAVVMLSGVQYYTGQYFEIQRITEGAISGWDLAHAVGNVSLELHDWHVDFACWCSYKYLNSGPGGIAGVFVHERFAQDFDRARMTGWWSHNVMSRFDMTNKLELNEGAAGYEISNPCILAAASLLGSLQVFEQAGGIRVLRVKSERLTAYLECLLQLHFDNGGSSPPVRIITPCDPAQRGCQLSLLLGRAVFDKVFAHLTANGVVCDERKPDCIRVAPVPLYNSFTDVWKFVEILRQALDL